VDSTAPARLGLARLYANTTLGSLPPQSRGQVRVSLATATNLRSAVDEFFQGDASAEEAAFLTDFAGKPLVVLTAGIGSPADHLAAQNHLAILSTNSAHRTIDKADHQALIAEQQGAATTTQAILDVVQAVRSHAPVRQ